MKQPIQKRIYLFPVGFLIFILSFTVFGNKGLLRVYELRQDKAKIVEELNTTNIENEKLKREIIALKSDRRYLESMARKDFGFVRSNEVIYQFSPVKK